MSERAAIEAIGVTKSYGATRALSGVRLQVLAGQVLALLGPNGAVGLTRFDGHVC
jgi:ABC-2 type transport system ATP-binding protein